MAADITKLVFGKLAEDRQEIPDAFFDNLQKRYKELAFGLAESYAHNAEMNGYAFDRNQELALVELFSKVILKTGTNTLSNPEQPSLFPSWSVVNEVMPTMAEQLKETVDRENLFISAN